MSHTTQCKGGTVFIHNGDFSGDVEIVEAGDPNDMGRKRVAVPFSDIKAFVASWARQDLIRYVEQAPDDAILLGEAGEKAGQG
jgi:hypothetical protein